MSKGHGRIETRRYWTMGNTEYLLGAQKWLGLKSIGMVESQREINGKVSIEQRYYILSLESIDRRLKISGAQWNEGNVSQVLKHRCASLNAQF